MSLLDLQRQLAYDLVDGFYLFMHAGQAAAGGPPPTRCARRAGGDKWGDGRGVGALSADRVY
jgi:hypothetical protein